MMRVAMCTALATLCACNDGFSLLEQDAGDVVVEPCPPQMPAQIVFFNQEEGVYGPGDIDDAATNTSTLLDEEIRVSRWPYTPGEFGSLVELCTARLQAFNIEVTIQDPGDVNHIEIVLGADDPAPSSTAGIPSNCVRHRRPIGFMDTRVYGGDMEAICDRALRQIGLTTGLDSTVDPSDVMAASGGPGRGYADTDAACGETGAQPQCFCTGEATQNSFARMLEAYGSRCPDQ